MASCGALCADRGFRRYLNREVEDIPSSSYRSMREVGRFHLTRKEANTMTYSS